LGAIFGTSLLVSRFGVGQFHPTTFVGLRLLVAGLAYALVYLLRLGGRRWPSDGRLWGQAALFGVFGTAVPMTAIVGSLVYQSSGVTALLLTTGPAVTVLMAHYLLPDERLTLKKGAGVLLALGGAVLLALRGESGLPGVRQASPTGYALVLGAILVGSLGVVLARRHLRSYHAFDVASIRILTALLVVLPLSICLAGLDFSQVDRNGLLSLLYAAVVGTFLGFLLEFYNIKRFGATASAMATYIVPVVATLGGVVLLDEEVTRAMIGVMVMIFGGVYLVNRG
jgi:drug/metabolite transporter (DMT)-like permease